MREGKPTAFPRTRRGSHCWIRTSAHVIYSVSLHHGFCRLYSQAQTSLFIYPQSPSFRQYWPLAQHDTYVCSLSQYRLRHRDDQGLTPFKSPPPQGFQLFCLMPPSLSLKHCVSYTALTPTTQSAKKTACKTIVNHGMNCALEPQLRMLGLLSLCTPFITVTSHRSNHFQPPLLSSI